MIQDIFQLKEEENSVKENCGNKKSKKAKKKRKAART